MNRFRSFAGSIVLLLAVPGHADTVKKAVDDTLPGNSVGSLSGFMIGATAGPVGAAVGAGIGWLVGGEAQKVTGLTDRAYEVERVDGTTTVVRSPGKAFSPGDQVRIAGSRLRADR